MLEYRVEQQHLSGTHTIEVYEGTSLHLALVAKTTSEDDLNRSLVGHNWQTVMLERDVSMWRLAKESQ